MNNNPRMKFDEQNFDKLTVVFMGKAFREKVGTANFDKLPAICQILQNFPSKFCTTVQHKTLAGENFGGFNNVK